MLQYLKKIRDLLTPAELRRGYLLFVMITIMALLEVGGVASIMPFMKVLANPEAVETNRWLNAMYTLLGFKEPKSFLFFLGVLVFFALVLSISFKALTTYALLRYTNMRNYSLSKRLVAGYLCQPYEWFLNRHSADLGKSILSEVGQVISGALIPMMQFIANSIVALALLGLLIAVDPMLALIVAVGVGGAYGLIYSFMRRYLVQIGQDRVMANRERFGVVQEAFGGIKDIKVLALENAMVNRFDGPAKRFARCQVSSQLVSQLPRFGLEVIAFGGILAVVLYFMTTRGGLQQTLPVIALYAFAGYRLMPALQQVYLNLSKIRFAGPALDALHHDLTQLGRGERNSCAQQVPKPLGVSKYIRLEGLHYTYPSAESPALNNLNFTIEAYTTVGLVGATGSGKSTTVDVILGLLRPSAGLLRVDGEPITTENLRSWQRTIGYVPQHIYLADDTVAANIAFGLPPNVIDQEAVERAARIANLHEFIVSDMPGGYDARVGERGLRLSGGQRQRVGIARALYHDPQVLVMDEATSALDNLTEQAVMEAVHNLGNRKTIILISHRLSTVRECDQIFLLEKGRLVGQGCFDELCAKNARFRSLARNI